MDKKHAEMLQEFVEITTRTIKTGTLNFYKELDYLFIILKGCGKDVKDFKWSYDQKISKEKFINILKLTPNLTNLKLRAVKLGEDEIVENPKKKLKLDLDICKNLKFVDSNDESVLNFFSLNFAQNLKLSLVYKGDYDQLINMKVQQTELMKKINVSFNNEVKEILRFSNLEDLRFSLMKYENDFIKEISTLKHLKVLKFDDCTPDYSGQGWKHLEDLKLEKLTFEESILNASFLRDLKLKSLRSLSLKGDDVKGHEFIFENLLINSPHLKVLKVQNSPHKINFYAKHFQNLEKLHLEFLGRYQYSKNLIEFETGIVNENLKELKVSYFTHNDAVNDLLEIVEIFPNLESIIAEWDADCDQFFANKFLFAKLNKLKHLKTFKCESLIYINHCLDFIVDGELIDDLKSLSKKLKVYDIRLDVVSDKIKDRRDFCRYFHLHKAFPITDIEVESFQLFASYLGEFLEIDPCENREQIILRNK